MSTKPTDTERRSAVPEDTDADRLAHRTRRALAVAAEAWDRAHRGLPSNPMTRAAAIPATGILAAALLDEPDADDETLTSRVERAIAIARSAWGRSRREPPGNPIAATAERSVIGILAAGILNHDRGRR